MIEHDYRSPKSSLAFITLYYIRGRELCFFLGKEEQLMNKLQDAVDMENKKAFDDDGTKFMIQNISDLHQFSEIMERSDSALEQIIDQTKKITRSGQSYYNIKRKYFSLRNIRKCSTFSKTSPTDGRKGDDG